MQNPQIDHWKRYTWSCWNRASTRLEQWERGNFLLDKRKSLDRDKGMGIEIQRGSVRSQKRDKLKRKISTPYCGTVLSVFNFSN